MTEPEMVQSVPFVTLSNSLLTNEVSEVVWHWRNGRITNYDAMKKIESIMKMYREDLYT